MSEYFIVVVRFCHQLLLFTQKSNLRRLISPLGEPDLKTYQSDFELWANSIKEEVQLLMAQGVEEQSAGVKVLSAFSQSESHRKQLKRYHRILGSCSTYDHQATWKEIRRLGHA